MHLVLAARGRLRRSYGPAYPQIAAALDAAISARSAAGLKSLAYDPEEGLPEFAVPPSPLRPDALAGQLAAIEGALAVRSGIIESLWIIGGPDIVPFGSLPNPMRDPDGSLLSDCVYGLADAREILARWPVGRTPDAEPPAPGLLAALLDQVAAAHRAAPRPPGPALGISSARWAAVSAEVFAAAGESQESLLLAPPARAASLRDRLATARRIYCNLHGVRGGPAWYGQSPADSELLPVLRPADIAGLRLDGAVVISQACFGARLGPAGGEPSLGPAILSAGAALLAAVGLSYGAPDPPPGESDLLAQELLVALKTPGRRLGEAVLAAHAAMLRDLLRRYGGLDADDVKTLLEFVLYGDPALPV